MVEAKPGSPSPVRLSFPPGELKRIKKGDAITFLGTPERAGKGGKGVAVVNCLLVPGNLPPGPK